VEFDYSIYLKNYLNFVLFTKKRYLVKSVEHFI